MKKINSRSQIKITDEFPGAENVAKYLRKVHQAHIFDYCPSPIENGFILDSYRPIMVIKNLIKKAIKKFPLSKGHIECHAVVAKTNKNETPSRFPGRVRQFLDGTGDW